MKNPPAIPPTGRRFPFGKLLLGVVAGLALVLCFGAGALLAYDRQYAERVYPGVSVDGVDVSGLTREDATTRLQQALTRYSAGSATIVIDGSPHQVPYAALGRRADVGALVDLALLVGRSRDGTLERAAAGIRSLLDGTRIGPAVVLDQEAVRRVAADVALAVNQAPVSGTATATPTGFAAQPAVPGKALPVADVSAALLAKLADPAAPDNLELSFQTVPVPPLIDDAEVATAIASATRMAGDVALASGPETWTIGAASVRSWIQFVATADGYQPTVDPAAPTKALAALSKTINVAPKEASFAVGSGNAVRVVAGANGRALDVAATAPLVAQAVLDRASGTGSPAPVGLVVNAVQPKLSTAAAQAVAPRMRQISSWTTYYEVSEHNGFGNNITIPALDLNGVVVAPGAVFDFWSRIGPVTTARGYRPGGAIINGHSQPTGALGGGICSTSTTLFNAVARAGYETLTRHNHYYYITRYPIGLDATVAIENGAVTTMSWRNDSQYPVMIRSTARPGVVSFSLWSVAVNNRPSVGGGSTIPGSTNLTYQVANGRTVSFATSPKRNYVAPGSSVQRTTALPPGRVQVVEYPDAGFDVSVTRTVNENGTQLHADTWVSYYATVNGLTLVGAKR